MNTHQRKTIKVTNLISAISFLIGIAFFAASIFGNGDTAEYLFSIGFGIVFGTSFLFVFGIFLALIEGSEHTKREDGHRVH
ncbi:hypothetical protein [Paenibacillus turpanensis]|uniref:hypothetical protein n=1 Tax=Paenibacillus turpanensis TaxID=2689078 RepID=UPI0014075316|nr:hypothetical protein [Paenibacillus turpanensis]